MSKLVVFLAGPQGAGKTTMAAMIDAEASARGLDSSIVKFAGLLYSTSERIQMHLNIPPTARKKFLVDLGDAIRKEFGEDILIKEVLDQIKRMRDHHHSPDILIIEDGRLPLEFEMVEKACADAGLAFVPLYLEAPEHVRRERTTDFRENTKHKTETGGFDLTKFCVVDTTNDINASMVVAEDITRRAGKDRAVPEFEHAVKCFNEHLRRVEEETESGANFRWAYGNDGKKFLVLDGVAPIVKPSPDLIAQAKLEVPEIMRRAESLVGRPEAADAAK